MYGGCTKVTWTNPGLQYITHIYVYISMTIQYGSKESFWFEEHCKFGNKIFLKRYVD